MQVYACKICGEPYLSPYLPIICPYCGAHQEYFVRIEGLQTNPPEIDEASREYAQQALQVEVDNAGFYRACARKTEDQRYHAMFRALERIETKHAQVFAHMLGEVVPEVPRVMVSDSLSENLMEARDRERRAVKLYGRAAHEAKEPLVKEIFLAIQEAEGDHIRLERGAPEE